MFILSFASAVFYHQTPFGRKKETHVNKIALGIVAVAGIAGATFGQATTPTAATYEFRIISTTPGLEPGAVVNITSARFVIQARATTANNTTNYGINRLSSGAITSNGTVARASSSSATNFGRFRAPSPVGNYAGFAGGGSGSNTATGNAATPSAGNDVNGRIAADGSSISGIDAYRGFGFNPIAGTDPIEAPEGNPFATSVVTNGSPSAWANLYAFNYTAPNGATQGSVTATGFLNIMSSISFQDVNGGQWIANQLSSVSAAQTFTFSWTIPTPGAAALLGLGGLVAGRRRR
jgi:hypothetical protein